VADNIRYFVLGSLVTSVLFTIDSFIAKSVESHEEFGVLVTRNGYQYSPLSLIGMTFKSLLRQYFCSRLYDVIRLFCNSCCYFSNNNNDDGIPVRQAKEEFVPHTNDDGSHIDGYFHPFVYQQQISLFVDKNESEEDSASHTTIHTHLPLSTDTFQPTHFRFKYDTCLSLYNIVSHSSDLRY